MNANVDGTFAAFARAPVPGQVNLHLVANAAIAIDAGAAIVAEDGLFELGNPAVARHDDPVEGLG